MRFGAWCAVAVALAAALSGCQDESDAASDARAVGLPDNLCAEIPESYTSSWGLAESDHATENASTGSTATCAMAGERAGAPVTLTVTVSTYGDRAGATGTKRMGDALEDACRDLAGTAGGDLVTDDFHCSVSTPAEPVETRGSVTDISRMVGIDGVLRVEMAHQGEAWQSVAPDVAGIAGSINSGIGSP